MKQDCIPFDVTPLRANKTGNERINVTLWRFSLTVVAIEKQEVLHMLSACSLIYQACKAHALYYIDICGLSGFTIHFHIIS
jgi:hypothetical protein